VYEAQPGKGRVIKAHLTGPQQVQGPGVE
jgi:hypothetical protein